MEPDFLKKRILDLVRADRLDKDTSELVETAIDNGVRHQELLARILGAFVYIKFGENEARGHWEKILHHYDMLLERVSPSIGILSAVYDYFLNQTDFFKNPLLIDHNLFYLIKKYAVVDSLSGVFNRNYFEIVLKKEIKRAIRYNKIFTLILFDIDNFKRINDRNGHVFGDSVIRHCAGLLKESCREEDIVCRYGGEEFVFFLPETPCLGAYHFAERVRRRVKDDLFLKNHEITLSGGIAEYPHDGQTVLNLLRCADSALYRAKAEGKDRVSLFENNRRRHPRYTKAFSVLFKPLEFVFRDGHHGELITDDISLSGLRCIFSEDLKPETEIVLSFTTGSDSISRIVTIGRIVWSKKIDVHRFMCGVQFQAMEQSQLQKMMKLISE
jgi:two-component system cell cycle response regulator